MDTSQGSLRQREFKATPKQKRLKRHPLEGDHTFASASKAFMRVPPLYTGVSTGLELQANIIAVDDAATDTASTKG